MKNSHAPRKTTRRTSVVALFALAAIIATAGLATTSSARWLGTLTAASVTTDKTDYNPGETVVISGSGFAAGEAISITLKEDPARHADTSLSAAADEYGNFVNKDFSPNQEHVGTTFTMTATGQSSGRSATATFTDGGSLSYSPASQTLNFTTSPSSQSAGFSQTVNAPASNGSFIASLLVVPTGVNPVPSGWVSTTALSYTNAGGSQSHTITVTVPGNQAAGTYTAQIKANPSVTGVGQGSGTALTVVVAPPPDTAPPNTSLSAANADSSSYNGVDWTNQDVTITLSATDSGSPASGVASTQYKIDSGSYQNYSVPFTISSEGLHTVTYFSTDNVGNVENPAHTFTVKIDKTNPSANCGSADGNWHAGNISITCSPSDSGGSGLVSSGDITLSTSVADGDEDANASTDSQQVCDTAGNCVNAGPVSGNMIDRKAPAVNCGSADGSWHAADVTINCTATDGGSGPATSNIALSTSVASGTEDANASTDSQQACDAVGNCATAGPVAGNKVDKKAPSISCGSADGNWHASDVHIGCTSSDGGSGLAVAGDASFSLSTSVTSGTETANASTGSHQVCDGVGNCDTAGPIGGNKVDKKGPSITITVPVANAVYTLNQVVASAYSVSDGGSGVASSTPASGSNIDTSSVGGKTFTVNATDNVGNPASASVNYSVIYNFNGFFQPIDNLPAQNVAKAGSAIPVKFSLSGNQGLGIFASGYPGSFSIACGSTILDATVEATVTAGNSSLSYDSLTDQYTYVWKTDKAWAGQCRQLQIKLADGKIYGANFKLTK